MSAVSLVELWRRPWCRLGARGRHYDSLGKSVEHPGHGPIWLCTDAPEGPVIDRKSHVGFLDNMLDGGRRVFVIPIPRRAAGGMQIATGRGSVSLVLHGIPDRPSEDLEPTTEEQRAAKVLLDRVKSVWARLREVETAIAEPALIWESLSELWLQDSAAADPEMDIIVHHARRLPPTLELLDRTPRRILRRTQRMLPLSRVQEVDRKAIGWLIRQPGETIAERAGNRQRIQAVAREENFNTLENRVLLSYARLAGSIARDYAAKQSTRTRSTRTKLVSTYGKRCKLVEKSFHDRGVFPADPDVIPNFVLQTNASYRKIWHAWQELLKRGRVLDELWRWQTRSWEEFCALVVIVALQSIPGARPVATSPLVFREEQQRGCWIRNVNPLAVFFLPNEGVTIEVSYRMRTGSILSMFGAPIWLRVGQVGDTAFLQRWAVWPIWDAVGGLESGEADEIARLLPNGKRESVAGGITIRPVAHDQCIRIESMAHAACLTIGPSGPALKAGIEQLRAHLLENVLRRAA